METSQTVRVSVTLAVFTVVNEQTDLRGSLPRLVSTGLPDGKHFHRGLFVITRHGDDLTAGSKPVLPSSFVRPNESIRDTARRIARDELGLERRGVLRQTGIFDAVGREGDNAVISIGYWVYANFDEVAPILGGRDRVGLELVSSLTTIDEQPGKSPSLGETDGFSRFGFRLRPNRAQGHKKVLSSEMNESPILGFDHDDIVFYSWRALRRGFGGRLDPVRFLGTRLFPDEFSLSELREFYEVCRGEQISPYQFRRDMQGDDSYIEPSGRISDSSRQGRGKPASLFKVQKWATPPPPPQK